MVQTLHQRKANEKFAKQQEKRMGKPEGAVKKVDRASTKSKVSGLWLMLLVFAVIGGLLFELIRMVWSRFA